MGCLFSRQPGEGAMESARGGEEAAPKQYSWDTRPKVDPKDFTIENVKGETEGRTPGSINGQQFIINNCEDANIYIFDHTATITVDDCTNCRIFLGPIKSSVFIRDCKDCKFVIACQQFRTRDCKNIQVVLSCATQPIIESSTGMKFGCFQYFYPELEEQFKQADLSVFNNNWSNIHDFTPVPGENNYSLIAEDAAIGEFLPLPTTDKFSSMQIKTDPESSVVPLTLGTRRKPADESCLIIFFHDGGSHDRASQFIKDLKKTNGECVLVQSKEITMQASDAQRVFGTDSYAMAVSQGPVIAFEYNGDNCCSICQETIVALSTGTTGLVFVSQSPSAAVQQIENFYNFADMQMSV